LGWASADFTVATLSSTLRKSSMEIMSIPYAESKIA
jgi:hypothetical protein